MSDRPIRVLAVSPIPEEGAGCRFRIAQYIPYLEANGFRVTLTTLFSTEFFRFVYKPGHSWRKALWFAALSVRQLWALRQVRRYDVVFIYREIFPVGPALIERLLSMAGCPPIVFDFDDAIFLPSVSEANRWIAALKSPGKVATIIERSAHVVPGNDYLASFAKHFNPSVTTIPTCVDTTLFRPEPVAPVEPAEPVAPVVGWIGSPTTAGYIKGLGGVFQQLAKTHAFTLRVSGTGEPIAINGVTVENPLWRLSGEIDLFRSCDIGVYPLEDDDWSRGKCGFKAIEFMACGVPVVASPVGVNREIIEDGVNGFLAATPEEWADRLGQLISDPALRARFAAAGRRTIEERYSLRVNAPRLAEVLRSTAMAAKEVA
jgi:glycosyltransferase involved in cell wall biosynthesis